MRWLICLLVVLAIPSMACAQATFGGEAPPAVVPDVQPDAQPTMETPEGRRGVFRGLIELRRSGAKFRSMVRSAKALDASGQEVTAENIAMQWVGVEASQDELQGFFDNFDIDDLIALLEIIMPLILMFL